MPSPGTCGECTADCNCDNRVSIDELVLGVNITLDHRSVSACPPMDADSNQLVRVNELVLAVNSALDGCPALPTPVAVECQPTPTPPRDCTACKVDCNCDGRVSIDEIILGINMALELRNIVECPSLDIDASREVTVDELVFSVLAAINDCDL